MTLTEEKKDNMALLLQNPLCIQRELNNRSFYQFLLYFWEEISSEPLIDNWHIEYLCKELQYIAERVGERKKKEYDLIINIPPGTSKTSICLRLFPAWCWTRWFDLKFITGSYSSALALESAEDCRDLIRSDKFGQMYPELSIKEDKDTKSNYRVCKKSIGVNRLVGQGLRYGGNRFSTSVGGSLTGFHGHILIWDDLLNPKEAASPTQLQSTNYWLDQVSSTRKVDKSVSVTIIIQQRIHQNDPTGHILSKKKEKIKHICLPGMLDNGFGKFVNPPELAQYYINGLLDPNRLNREALKEMEQDLGQYGFSGQVGQNPVPPGGGMFKVDKFTIIDKLPLEHDLESTVIRYWDKAGTQGGGAFTCGVKMYKTMQGKYIVADVVRGQYGTDDREDTILRVAKGDGVGVDVRIEQEPGSGGKESAENTVKNLAGFMIDAERPQGDKVYRADPYSVQVNWGNVMLLHGEWNKAFIEEHRFFPFGRYKDQVDAAAGAFAYLNNKREARVW